MTIQSNSSIHVTDFSFFLVSKMYCSVLDNWKLFIEMKFELRNPFSSSGPISDKYADVCLHVGDKEKRIKAHKLILAYHSPYFDRIFQCSGNIPIIHVCFPAVHPETVENAIKLMYGNSINVLSKYSKKFSEFLRSLEVNYDKGKMTESDTQKQTDVIAEELVKENVSSVENIAGKSIERQSITTPDSESTPNMPEAKRGDKTEGRQSTKPSKFEPPAAKKIKLQETKLHNPSESRTQPEAQQSGSKSAKRKSEYFDPKDNWTETSETTIVEKLEAIDFKLKGREANEHKEYKCNHCGDMLTAFAAAEAHFISKHQNCGDAPKVLEMAIKYHKTALDSFAETRQELQKGCNQILANNQLV
jgi:hypothetical protein